MDIEKSEAVGVANYCRNPQRSKIRARQVAIFLLVFIGVFWQLQNVCSGKTMRNDYGNDNHLLFGKGLNMGPPNMNPSLTPEMKYLRKGRHAAVASDIDICSKLGGKVLLELQGHAADAAVTVGLCIGLINSFSSGIGGGGFIVSSRHNAADGSNDLVSIDAREQAPAAAYKEMFEANESKNVDIMADWMDGDLEHMSRALPSRFGGLAVGIPGELKGLYNAHKLHGSGKVTWKQLIEPVIELAENGWNASSLLEKMLHIAPKAFQRNYKLWPMYVKNYNEVWDCEHSSLNSLTKCFEKVDLMKEGDWVKRPNLAKTLRLIANNGSDAIFYDPQGPIAKSLVKTIKDHHGIATEEDFAQYNVKIGRPLSTSFLDKYEVLVPHTSSSSGIAVLSGINVMNEYYKQNHRDPDFAVGGDLTEIQTQRLVEVMKWMGSVRTKLGDYVEQTNESSVDISDDMVHHRARIEKVLGEEWAHQVFNNISDNHTLKSWKDYKPEFQPVDDNGTAHFSIVDQYNNSVSMTTSVNLLFGSFLHDLDTGIILNDQMDDFSIPSDAGNAFDLVPSIYNYIEPYKRPLSSMVPTIVFKKNRASIDTQTLYGIPHLTVGGAGGSRIYTSIFQAVVRKCMYQMPLLETIAYPRLHHQLLPEVLYMENYTGTAFKKQMQVKGHRIEVTESKSVVNGIARDEITNSWHAVSDWWRKHGVAWAY